MGKNAEIRLVASPVLGQVLGMVERGMFERLAREHGSDRYYKASRTWTHFVTTMFARTVEMRFDGGNMRRYTGSLPTGQQKNLVCDAAKEQCGL